MNFVKRILFIAFYLVLGKKCFRKENNTKERNMRISNNFVRLGASTSEICSANPHPVIGAGAAVGHKSRRLVGQRSRLEVPRGRDRGPARVADLDLAIQARLIWVSADVPINPCLARVHVQRGVAVGRSLHGTRFGDCDLAASTQFPGTSAGRTPAVLRAADPQSARR